MKKFKSPQIVKTSISLPMELWDFAVGAAEHGQFPSVSAYIADLIRDERSKSAKLIISPERKSSSSTYPSHRPQVSALNEPAEKKKKAG